jgi:hypothetical protein
MLLHMADGHDDSTVNAVILTAAKSVRLARVAN